MAEAEAHSAAASMAQAASDPAAAHSARRGAKERIRMFQAEANTIAQASVASGDEVIRCSDYVIT